MCVLQRECPCLGQSRAGDDELNLIGNGSVHFLLYRRQEQPFAVRQPCQLCVWPLQGPHSTDGPTVVGMGLCCMDYLAQVASYPSADAKLRTEQLEVS